MTLEQPVRITTAIIAASTASGLGSVAAQESSLDANLIPVYTTCMNV